MQKARILVVDDDYYGLAFFRSSLQTLGFDAVICGSANEAEARLREEGGDAYLSVLTDYRMPRRNGLELLQWIREFDASLSTVIVTAEGEKQLVQQALRHGAADFIEKPVSVALLGETMRRAVETTQRNRKLLTTDEEVRAAGQIHFIFEPILVPELAPRLCFFLKEREEVGGDFFNLLPMEPGRSLIVAGDVSGHSVRSGFVSAYFQGLTRGITQGDGHSLVDMMDRFNRILNHERTDIRRNGKVGGTISLSVCAGVVDERSDTLELLAAGAPPWMLVDRQGRVSRPPALNPPLGWRHEQPLRSVTYSLPSWNMLYLCSDGLEELADELAIDSCSLAYRLLKTNSLEDIPHEAPDDVLVIRLLLHDSMTAEENFQPLIVEQYAGDEYGNIDRIQDVWRRSLQFSLGDRIESRLYEVLLCCREAVLNAMLHGCDKSADKVCHFSLLYHAASGVVRVRVDDPGKGHSFDIQERVRQMTAGTGRHLGLAIIDDICDEIETKNAGSTLTFEIALI